MLQVLEWFVFGLGMFLLISFFIRGFIHFVQEEKRQKRISELMENNSKKDK